MDLQEYEALQPSMHVSFGDAKLVFVTPNRHAAWRVDTAFSKEPDTVEWIGEFAAGAVLVDVGANMGLYSIMAASRGVRVYAFEPESQNYALLNRNIYLNGMGELVSAYSAALSDRASFSTLYLSTFDVAGSCHSFGEAVTPRGHPMRAAFAQGCYSTTLDELVGSGALPVPNHVKIDVDGIEHKVLAGAARTLQDRRLKSVLVEVDTALENNWKFIDHLLDLGFDYSREEAQTAMRKDGMFKGVGNHVFRR
ncbi:MAG: FkbM family methyltransferase [Betaproteobacteria bacterium]|nr:FkbM family methyltransferase [Betaproteobacteria bacterium]